MMARGCSRRRAGMAWLWGGDMGGTHEHHAPRGMRWDGERLGGRWHGEQRREATAAPVIAAPVAHIPHAPDSDDRDGGTPLPSADAGVGSMGLGEGYAVLPEADTHTNTEHSLLCGPDE